MVDDGSLKSVRIRLLWHAQAQFAGYLIAEQAALGTSRGITLKTSPIDFGCGSIEALCRGEVEFAVASPAHLLESPHAAQLVMVLAVQQDSALVYPAHRDRGIERIADLAGRRVGVWPGHEDLELRWMLLRAGVAPEAVTRVPMVDTIGPFLAGDVDCAQTTVYHELRRVVDALGGADRVTLFRAGDHGAALLKDGLLTTRRMAREHPDVVQAVVDTVIEGWAIAFAEPARAVDACLHANPTLARDDQAEQLREIHKLAQHGAARVHGLGYPDPQHMTRAAQAMSDLGYRVPPDIDAANSVEFWSRSSARAGRGT